MEFIDFGLGVFCATVFAEWPGQGAFDLADIYNDLSIKGKLAGWESGIRFYEIGTPEGLAETDLYVRMNTGRLATEEPR